MNASDINFDDDRSMEIKVPEQEEAVSLEISDFLDAYDEELSESYKEKISNIINSSGSWYNKCLDIIKEDKSAGTTYRLMSIYVLSEQKSSPIEFGVLFRVDRDIEHGRGMKLEGASFSILDYGLGDVAFS